MFTAQQYVKVSSLEEAYTLNQKKSSSVLGGGCWMKMGKRRIGTLIDLSGLGLDTIEETEDSFILGAMVTLRQMETDARLKTTFGSGFADMVRHIVGVQFRNCATLGGSLYSRFGFSDILTWLLALDCDVELAGAGIIPLAQYAATPYDRDVLARVIVHKTGRKAVYESFRNTETDIPVLTCAASSLNGDLRLVIGGRPMRALTVDGLALTKSMETIVEKAQSLPFGSNMRASAQYRRHLAGVLVKRAVLRLREVE